jgi:hypothetical protein
MLSGHKYSKGLSLSRTRSFGVENSFSFRYKTENKTNDIQNRL